MKTMNEIANELVDLETLIASKARKEFGDEPRAMMMSGKCVDMQWIDEITMKLYKEHENASERKDVIEECIEKLKDYQEFSGTDMSKYIKELEEIK